MGGEALLQQQNSPALPKMNLLVPATPGCVRCRAGLARRPKPSTLCRARAKLSEDTLCSIHARWLDNPGGKAAAQRGLFRGFRIYALDGMSAIVPDTEELDTTFGRVRTGKEEARHPSALVVTLWDAGACMPLDWVVARGRSGERVAAMQFFDNLQKDDLLVGDRGFPSRRILFELAARERHFLFRDAAPIWRSRSLTSRTRCGRRDAGGQDGKRAGRKEEPRWCWG